MTPTITPEAEFLTLLLFLITDDNHVASQAIQSRLSALASHPPLTNLTLVRNARVTAEAERVVYGRDHGKLYDALADRLIELERDLQKERENKNAA